MLNKNMCGFRSIIYGDFRSLGHDGSFSNPTNLPIFPKYLEIAIYGEEKSPQSENICLEPTTPVYPNGSLFPIRFVASFSSSFLDSILVSGLLGMKHESSGKWHGYDITLSYNSSLTWKKTATLGYSPYHWVFFHGWIKSLDSPSFQWGRTLTPLPQWDDNYFTKHISIHPLGREIWPTLPPKSL